MVQTLFTLNGAFSKIRQALSFIKIFYESKFVLSIQGMQIIHVFSYNNARRGSKQSDNVGEPPKSIFKIIVEKGKC